MLQYLSVYRSWFQSHGSAHKLVNFEIIIIIFVSKILLNTIISHVKTSISHGNFHFIILARMTTSRKPVGQKQYLTSKTHS